MSVETTFELNRNGDLTVRGYQDAEDIAKWAQHCRDTQKSGGDLRYKWSLPNNLVAKFYAEYAGPDLRPMNQEFWQWVDKSKMNDPQYKTFRTDDPGNPYFSGYKSKT